MARARIDGPVTGVQVIAKAAEILRALEAEPDGLSIRRLSERLGLPRSTVHRIVAALQQERLVASASPQGRAGLGPGLYRLAAASLKSIRQTLHPYLEELSRALGETVDLAILEADRVLFVDQVLVPRRLQAASAVGTYFPTYCTANGKALLSELPLEEVERLVPSELPSCSQIVWRPREALLRELAAVRHTHIAYDREEHTLGICGVGCAVRDAFGRLAAISVPVPRQRFSGSEERIAAQLLRVRAQILKDMGEE